jgi:hypothetical protein
MNSIIDNLSDKEVAELLAKISFAKLSDKEARELLAKALMCLGCSVEQLQQHRSDETYIAECVVEYCDSMCSNLIWFINKVDAKGFLVFYQTYFCSSNFTSFKDFMLGYEMVKSFISNRLKTDDPSYKILKDYDLVRPSKL